MRQTWRKWLVTLRDGTRIEILALHRAMARHYSKSERSDYVSSKDHYRDVLSVRLICEADIPF